MTTNRIEQTSTATVEKSAANIAQPPAIGAVIGQTALKVVTAVVAIAAVLVATPGLTLPAWATAAAGSIVALGTVFGLLSPGIRRQPPS